MTLKINEEAVLAVALAIAKAHHGEDATDSGGYMQEARTFIAAGLAVRDFEGDITVEAAPAVLPEDGPVQEPMPPPETPPEPQWAEAPVALKPAVPVEQGASA